MNCIIRIGKSIDTGLPVHVSVAKNGRACRCICYECGEAFQAVQPANEAARAWHFRHDSGKSNCLGDRNKGLHDYAQHLLLNHTSINTRTGRINYSNARKEVSIGIYRSDLTATLREGEIHFEVIVTHNFLNSPKEDYLKLRKINCLRIALTAERLLTATPGEIQFAVLEDTNNKAFIPLEDGKEQNGYITTDPSFMEIILGGILFAGAGYLINRILTPRRKRKRNHYRL